MDDSTRRQLRNLLVRLVARLSSPDDNGRRDVLIGPIEAGAWRSELRLFTSVLEDDGGQAPAAGPGAS
jgi:hypothetical protein